MELMNISTPVPVALQPTSPRDADMHQKNNVQETRLLPRGQVALSEARICWAAKAFEAARGGPKELLGWGKFWEAHSL